MKPPEALLDARSSTFDGQKAKSYFPNTQIPKPGQLRPDEIVHTQHCTLDASEDFASAHLLRTCPDLVHPQMPKMLPIEDTMDYSYSDEDIPNLIGTEDDDDGGGSCSDGRRTPPDFRHHLDAMRKGDLCPTKMRQISFSCLDEPLPVNIQSLLMELGNEDTHDLTLSLDSIIDTSSYGNTASDLPDDLVRWSD